MRASEPGFVWLSLQVRCVQGSRCNLFEVQNIDEDDGSLTFFRLARVSILSVGSAPTESRKITGISAFCNNKNTHQTKDGAEVLESDGKMFILSLLVASTRLQKIHCAR